MPQPHRPPVLADRQEVPVAVSVGVAHQLPRSRLRPVAAARPPGQVEVMASGPEPLVHVVVLVPREPLVVAAQLHQGLPAEHRVRNGVRESLRRGAKRAARRSERGAKRPGRELRGERVAGGLEDHAAAAAGGAGPLELLEADPDVVPVVARVRAENAHVVRRRLAKPGVERVRREPVRIVEYAQARIARRQLLEHLARSVRRASVDHQHLEVDPRCVLLEHRGHGALDPADLVAHGHHGGDHHHSAGGPTSSRYSSSSVARSVSQL